MPNYYDNLFFSAPISHFIDLFYHFFCLWARYRPNPCLKSFKHTPVRFPCSYFPDSPFLSRMQVGPRRSKLRRQGRCAAVCLFVRNDEQTVVSVGSDQTRWMWGVAMQCLTVEKSLQAWFNSLSLLRSVLGHLKAQLASVWSFLPFILFQCEVRVINCQHLMRFSIMQRWKTWDKV